MTVTMRPWGNAPTFYAGQHDSNATRAGRLMLDGRGQAAYEAGGRQTQGYDPLEADLRVTRQSRRSLYGSAEF